MLLACTSSLPPCLPRKGHKASGGDTISWHMRRWQVWWGAVALGFCCTAAGPYPGMPAGTKLLEVEQRIRFFSTTKVRAGRC